MSSNIKALTDTQPQQNHSTITTNLPQGPSLALKISNEDTLDSKSSSAVINQVQQQSLNVIHSNRTTSYHNAPQSTDITQSIPSPMHFTRMSYPMTYPNNMYTSPSQYSIYPTHQNLMTPKHIPSNPTLPTNPYMYTNSNSSYPFQYPYPYYNYNCNLNYNKICTSVSKQRKKDTTPKEMLLHESPMEQPSPFVKTHVLLPYKIVIYKQEGESFGVEVRYEKRGTFVKTNENHDLNSSIQNGNDVNVNINVPKDGDTSNTNQHEDIMKLDDVTATYERESEKEKTESKISIIQNKVEYNDLNTNILKVSEEANEKQEEHKTNGIHENMNELDGNMAEVAQRVTGTAENNHNLSNTKLTSCQKNSMLTEIKNVSNIGGVKDASVNDQVNSTPKKAKRKKISVGVMTVTGAEKQNCKAKIGIAQNQLLQTNDIILDINGHSLAGLTFQEGGALFAKCGISANDECVDKTSDSKKEERIIECVLTVAREKKVIKILEKLSLLEKPMEILEKKKTLNLPKQQELSKSIHFKSTSSEVDATDNDIIPTVKVPFVIDEKTNKVSSGDFCLKELEALIYSVRVCNGKYDFFLNETETSSSDDSLYGIASSNPRFAEVMLQRTAKDFIQKWMYETSQMDRKLVTKALHQWELDWRKENEGEGGDSTDLNIQYMPDSQRSMLRSLPKPARGCKCGSVSHELVSDPECVLYRNLRRFSPHDSNKANENTGKASGIYDKYDGKLTRIGSAHVQRIKKRAEEEESLKIEASFVDEMENIQVTQLKQAVFTPSVLTIIVLSSIASICDDADMNAIADRYIVDLAFNSKDNRIRNEEDIDENMPLVALGKRKTEYSTCDNTSLKRKKVEQMRIPSSYCLGLLLLHISKTWGHIYQEPDHVDYAWHEECRKSTIKSNLETADFKRNPRQPGSLSFEILKFTLDESFMSRLKTKDCTEPGKSNQEDESFHMHDILILHLVSDLKTGLMKEIESLLTLGMIQINKKGFTELQQGWEKKLNPFILNDMWETGWGKESDTQNKFRLHDEIRNTIDNQWKRDQEAWMPQSRESNACHYHHEYDYNRQTFENQYEDYVDKIDGIAQFGI